MGLWLLLTLSCLCGISAVAADERPDPSTYITRYAPHLFSQLAGSSGQAFGGKRAYSYRSEFKRLPVYEFGLGKRSAPVYVDKKGKGFGFGLGKRTRLHNFGIGKRSSFKDLEVMAPRLDVAGLTPDDYYNAYLDRHAMENYLESKRSLNSNFGLGKRDAMYDRVPYKSAKEKFVFGVGKRQEYESEAEEELDDSEQA